MTITQVELIGENGYDDDSGRHYVETYAVYFTSGYSTAALLANSNANLPKKGWYLGQSPKATSSDTSVFANKITPSLMEASMDTPISGCVGEAQYVVEYKTPALTIFDRDVAPLSRPAQIRWGGSDATEARRYDVNGDAITNSAGQFFDNLPSFYIRGGEVSITLNISANPADICVLYSFTTNGSDWYGVGRGNALMGKIEATKQYEIFQGTEYTYWTITYPIMFRRDGWGFKTYDIGTQYIDDDDSIKSYIDANGVAQETLLDGLGRPWDGDPILWPDGTTADEGGFRVYEEGGWGFLSIPNPFA
jgi:hypothetical protein